MPRFIVRLSLTSILLGSAVASQAQAGPSDAAPRADACRIAWERDRLVNLTPEGDLLLASGTLAKVAEIRLPTTSAARSTALARMRTLVDQPVLVAKGADSDRWGRRSARIRIDRTGGVDLAESLVEEGLGLVDPGTAEQLCRPELLAFEETARERNLGLWADDLYKPLDASKMNSLQERFGTFVLVEGQVKSIGERKQSVYLNFGGHWAEDFTIIIPRRIWRVMAEKGVTATTLKGQRIRARGILEPWQGAALTVVVPQMIERLEGKPPSR
ncbi:thermonuclease family protein [Microvirga rosea]|uniref:thermonuclease family protein n=1 Tax=Microvirga rosea TaxID=2715425 RepID=UPI001D0BC82C|nr:thermonuclease family protein [Microvirga rosea]MCB8818949.1 thermonuclease family protein [Microvirga rosea]